MTKELLEDVFSEAIADYSEDTNQSPSDYQLTDELIKLGYDFDSTAIYIPYTFKFEDNRKDTRDIYLKISRNVQSKVKLTYSWTSKEDGKYRVLNLFTRDKLLAEENIDESGKSSINKKLSYCGRISRLNAEKGSYKDFFEDLLINIVNSPCLEIFKEADFEFQVQDEDDISEAEESEISEIEKAIEYRRCPTLTDEETRSALEVEAKIKEIGLIPYYDNLVEKFHIGNHKNIYRKHIGGFNVIRGKGSYFFGTTAQSGEGKTLEDIIAFLKLIPSEYIFKKNQMTLASFSRYGEASPYYFERMIVYFGDLGGRKSFEKVEDVFDIIKTLITEKEFSRDISEGTSKGGFANTTLDLIAKTVGAVFQTVKVDFLGEDFEQYESRSILSTPFEANSDKVLDLIFSLTAMEDSIENKAQKEADKEIAKYHCYLKHLITKGLKIVNPFKKFFKKLVKHSEIANRDLKQLLELFDGYCCLTYFDCEVIDGRLIASEKQLKEFVNDICLDNTLAPIESDFIKMLVGNKEDGQKTKYALTIFDLGGEDEDLEDNPFQSYHNAVLEAIGELQDREQSEFQAMTIEELDFKRREKAIAKLLELFKLKGSSLNHEENAFFRVSDIKGAYSNRRAYKNVDNVGNLLNKLYDRGFVDKLDFYDSRRQNIYFLTRKCEEIIEAVILEDDEIDEAIEFLKRQGIYKQNKE